MGYHSHIKITQIHSYPHSSLLVVDTRRIEVNEAKLSPQYWIVKRWSIGKMITADTSQYIDDTFLAQVYQTLKNDNSSRDVQNFHGPFTARAHDCLLNYSMAINKAFDRLNGCFTE